MKKLLMLGTAFGSVDIIKRAKDMGLYTIVTDYNEPEKSKAKQYADEYWMINTNDLDSLEQKCRLEQVDAVISGASDFNCGKAIELCERLGLPSYCSSSTWLYSVNKFKFKEVCRQEGVTVAKDYYLSNELSDEELERVAFPVVVKPADQCGNLGVSYCYNKEELVNAYRYAQSVSNQEDVIVEQMLHGQEYNVYYAMADGEVHLINAATEHHQPGYPANLYSVITSVSSHVEQFNEEINEKLINVLKQIGCREGMGWVELILNDDGRFYVIEMGYRFGSDMMCTAFDKVCPFDGIKWMIECALGEKHEKRQLPLPQSGAYTKCVCSYGFFSSKDGIIGEVSGLDRLSEIPGVTIDFIREIGDEVAKHRLLGEVVFATDDCEEMLQKIEEVNQILSIKDSNKEDMMIYFTDYRAVENMYQEGLNL